MERGWSRVAPPFPPRRERAACRAGTLRHPRRPRLVASLLVLLALPGPWYNPPAPAHGLCVPAVKMLSGFVGLGKSQISVLRAGCCRLAPEPTRKRDSPSLPIWRIGDAARRDAQPRSSRRHERCHRNGTDGAAAKYLAEGCLRCGDATSVSICTLMLRRPPTKRRREGLL